MRLKNLSIPSLVILSLLAITTILLSLFETLNYFTTKDWEIQNLKQSLALEADRISASLVFPLENAEHHQVAVILESMMRDSTLAGIVLTSLQPESLVISRIRSPAGVLEKSDSSFSPQGLFLESRWIGNRENSKAKIQIFATPKYVEARLTYNFYRNLGSSFVLIPVLVFSLYLLLRFLILLPLSQVKSFAAGVTTGQRQGSHGPFWGEMDSLRRSIEEMVQQLDSRYAQIQREISDRQRAEAHLIESEAKFRSLFESAGDAIFLTERGMLIDCNRSTEILFRCERQDLIGSPSLLLLEPIQPNGTKAEEILQETRQLVLSGKSVTMEILQRRRDGSNFTAECSLNESRFQGRSVVQVVLRDITARKIAEEKLRLSEANLNITLQSIGDGVIATDAKGLITRMNFTAERMTGWILPEAKGRPLTEVFRIVNAKSKDLTINPVDLVLEKGKVVGLANHTTLLSRDGKEFQIADSAAPIRNDLEQIVGVVLVFSDVTEEYKIQEALKNSRDVLERTGQIAKIGAWDLDLITMKLFWSEETCRIFEVDPPVAPSVEVAIQYYAPDAQSAIAKAVQNAITHGMPYDLELPLITAKGRHIWTRSQGTPIFEDGKVIKLVGAFQDITARKNTEVALNDERERIQTYLDVIETMVVALNAKGEIASINRKGCQIMGWEEKELLGRNWFELCLPQPQGIEFVYPFFLRLMSGELAGTEYQENPILNKNGELREIAWHNAILRDKQGNIIGTLSSGEDITERKRAQESLKRVSDRLSLATRAGGVGVWDYELHGNKLTWDDQMLALYGLARQQFEGAYESWQSRIHPEDVAQVNIEVQLALKGEKDFDTEFRIQWPNGTLRNIRALGSVTRDAGDKALRMVGTNWDITDSKLAQESARLHHQQILQADKMNSLGMMVSGVAHEINNPNNLIMLNADVLESIWTHLIPVLQLHSQNNPDWKIANIPYAKAERQIETLIQGLTGGSKRIKRIVDNLKDFARIDAGEISESISMEKVIEAAVAIVDNLIRKSTDHFSIQNGVNLPKILGNFQKLEQVIINLITNACQALEGRTKAITVITWHDAQTNRVVVQIKDEGRGISKDFIAKVADPFFTTKRDTGGTGLGLSVTYGIIKEHQGEITFESELNQGSCITFKIPAQISMA